MSKEDREAALQGLRVWYYLREMVKYPAEIRSIALTMIPGADRELVEIRLKRWDKLPPDLQTEVMEHERMFRYVLQLDGLNRAQQEALAHDLPESLREKWDDRLEKWHHLTLERRQQIYGQFQKMFNLSPRERNKVLETLSEQDRTQAERSLLIFQALEKLPLAEQKACIDAFLSFIESPPNSNQRNQRLEELSRWRAYPADVKASWNSVFKFVPPLPGQQPPLPGTPQAMQGTTNLPTPALPGAANQTTPLSPKSALVPQK